MQTDYQDKLRKELARRRDAKSAAEPAVPVQEGPCETIPKDWNELLAATAQGFVAWLDGIQASPERAAALRLACSFEMTTRINDGQRWLDYIKPGENQTNAERLRLALVQCGFVEIRRHDDPITGAELADAAMRIFEGGIKWPKA